MMLTCNARVKKVGSISILSRVSRLGMYSVVILVLLTVLFPAMLLAEDAAIKDEMAETQELLSNSGPSADELLLPKMIDAALKQSYESYSLSQALKLALLKDKNADKLFKPTLTLSGKIIDLYISEDAELRDPSIDFKATQSLLVPGIGGQFYTTLTVGNSSQSQIPGSGGASSGSSDVNTTFTMGYTRPIFGAKLELLSSELGEELALLNAKKSYRDGIGNIVSSTASAIFEMAEYRNQMVSALFELAVAKKDLEVKKQRLAAGLIAASEVSTADNALITAEEEYMNRKDAYIQACKKLKKALGLEDGAEAPAGYDPLAEAEQILVKVEALEKQLDDILFGSGATGDFIGRLYSAVDEIMTLDYYKWPEIDEYYAGLELTVEDPSASPVTRDLSRIGELTTKLAEIDLALAERSYGWNLNLSTEYSTVTDGLSAGISFSKTLMSPKKDEDLMEKRINLEKTAHNAKDTLRSAIEAYEALVKGVRRSENLARISAEQRDYAVELVDATLRKYKSGLATEFDLIKQVAHKVKTDANYADIMAEVVLAKLRAILTGSDIIDDYFAGVAGNM